MRQLTWYLSDYSLLGRLRLVAILGGCALTFFLLIRYEPQGPRSCEYVDVLGVGRCGRAGQCFLVKYVSNGQTRSIGIFADKPFAVDYVGRAALFLRRGRWTGSYHFMMAHTCERMPSNFRWSGP